ncbi:MAG TPA: tetratricopeptide repeat protein, partial [candidate division Zixibacteria bacterium]|nr:tetratricopeptide repeat protein [candidate division Zixibacteria bacterium]
LRLGMSYVFDGRMQQGLPYFRKAKQYEGKLPPRDRDLLDVYSDIWLEREFDRAFTKLEMFVRNYPDDKEGRSIFGILIFQFQRDTTKAYAQLDSALMIDPMCLLSHMFSMNISSQMGNIDKTIKTALEIKKFYPNAPLAYEELGRVYRLQMEYDKSINEFKQLYAGFPSTIWALLEISELFVLKRQFDSANYYLTRAYQVSGSDPVELRRYFQEMAGLNVWKGQFKKAISSQKQAVEYSRQVGDSAGTKNDLDVLGRFYYRLGNNDSALIFYQQGYKLATSLNKINYPFVLMDTDFSQREEAKKIFKKDLPGLRTKMPRDLMPIIDAIEILFEAAYLADTAKIIAAAKELKKLQPSSNNSLDTWDLGVTLVSFGQFEEGKNILTNFVQGKDLTSSAFIYLLSNYYIGMANEGLNKKKEAIKNYNEVLRYWGNPDIEIKYIRDTRERLAKLSA